VRTPFKMLLSVCAIYAAMLSSFVVAAKAEDSPLKPDSLYSRVLNEKRALQVILPKGYKQGSSTRYDVLYVLDGETVTPYASRTYSLLQGEDFLPELIIVGIPNTNLDFRERDLTPTHVSGLSGGADKFLAFLKSELVPYVEKTYPAKTGGNTLYGGSLAGLFVLYAFVNEPSLFKSYIAIDPSLWWDHGYVNKLYGDRLANLQGLQKSLWIAGREGYPFQFMGTAAIDAILKAKAPEGLAWMCVPYPNETHFSMLYKGLWDGLKFSYGGYYGKKGIELKPMNGIALEDKPFELWCYNLLANRYLRYTTDGKEPTSNAAQISFENTLRLKTATTLTVKSFAVRDEHDKIVSGKFEIGAVLPAVDKPDGAKAGGLHYSYYEGDWSSLPDFKSLNPTRSGLAGSDFDLASFSPDASFSLVLDGYIEIREEGYYIFELGGGGGSRVYLGQTLLIGDHYKQEYGETFMVPLQKGFYPFRVEYMHRKRGSDLVPVYLKPEGQEDFPIPPEMEYSHNMP
jgi:predicted alpha/beta superfamily hydrolase